MSIDQSSSAASIGTLGIVGVGLLGGSIAAALRKGNHVQRVIGIGRKEKRLAQATKLGLIDEYFIDIKAAAPLCDVMIFCTPVDRIVSGVQSAASTARTGTLLTDVGSVKGCICEPLASELPDGITFIGSHPIAGSEKTGFENAKPELFESSVCVVTPTESQRSQPTFDAQLARTKSLWTLVGAEVVEMTPGDHDAALAQTSHLPHIVAAALANSVDSEHLPLAATGYRDTTRIAAGDPDMWVAISLDNADAILESVDQCAEQLLLFRNAIKNRDAAALKKLLQDAKTNRDKFTR